jgi:hypothetical protein
MNVEESPFEVDGRKTSSQVCWIGAVSFESRCVGSLSSLVKGGFRIAKAIAFDYPTKLSPKNSGEQRRAANRSRFEKLLGSSVEFQPINPYRYAEFIGEMYRVTEQIDRDFSSNTTLDIIIDITCLTKVHALALAYWFTNRRDNRSIVFAYSQPQYYGNPSKNIWGKGRWHGTTLMRLDLDSTDAFHSTNAIILLGHEGDRLRLALNEIEPSNALIIKTLPRDPTSELFKVTDVQNSWLFLEMKEGVRRFFRKEGVPSRDLSRLLTLVGDYCQRSLKQNARIVLCPFGPKPFVFASGYQCLMKYKRNSWLSYPRPLSYDQDYSEGYSHTLWFSL